MAARIVASLLASATATSPRRACLYSRPSSPANFGVCSIDGNLAVDFLGRFETLEQDLRSALEQVGLSSAEALPDAKTRFRPGSVRYRDHYDEDTRSIVADWYASEIKLLGYEF
jgi:hypothetical protein